MDEKEKGILEEAKNELIKVTKILSELLESDSEKATEELVDWMKDRVEFWCRIYNEGGVVTKERAHEIWEKDLGKDVRGFGGFFVGRGASLQWTANEKVVLTANASDAIKAWTGKSIGEYAKKFGGKEK